MAQIEPLPGNGGNGAGGTSTYSWRWVRGKVNCFKSKKANCKIPGLWESTELTEFHDAPLAQATKEINAILDRLEKSNKDPGRKLRFIEFRNRHFLVWTTTGTIGPEDDKETIVKALRLKRS